MFDSSFNDPLDDEVRGRRRVAKEFFDDIETRATEEVDFCSKFLHLLS